MKFVFHILLALNFLEVIYFAPKTFEEFQSDLNMRVGGPAWSQKSAPAKRLWDLAIKGCLTSEGACHFLYGYLYNSCYPFSEENFLKFKYLILQIYVDNDKKKSFENHFTRLEFEKFKLYKEYTSDDQLFRQVAGALCLDPQDMSLKSDVDSLVRSLIFQDFDFEADEFNDFISYFVDWMAAEKSFDRDRIDLEKFKSAIASGFAEMVDLFDQKKAEGLRNFWFNPNYADTQEEQNQGDSGC